MFYDKYYIKRLYIQNLNFPKIELLILILDRTDHIDLINYSRYKYYK